MIKNTPNKIKVIFYAAIVFHISIHSNVMADTMMESISKTINSNPELASSENTVFEAKARKKASASTFYPRLDAIGNIGGTKACQAQFSLIIPGSINLKIQK